MTRSVRRLTSRDAVLHALALYDELGSNAFLGDYGFGRSYRYQLVHDGRDYDSKAVAGVAFGFQYPSLGPLRSDEFSGGNSGAAHVLRRLGFDIRSTDTEPRVEPRGAGVAGAGSLAAEEPAFTHGPAGAGTATRIFLVGCVKTKSAAPAPARDLYTSDLFKKRRAYVESAGGRWFVLSAQHGLVAPNDLLEPYDMALKDQPAAYRGRWGRAVVEALVERLGPLNELNFEVHAGAAYADALRQPLLAAGGRLVLPLAGLAQGQQLSWYLQRAAGLPSRTSRVSAFDAALQALTKPDAARSPRGFPWRRSGLVAAGLYAWYVDEVGARSLTRGLGIEVPPGLVYAGQAGATAWPSGTRRSSTLLSRIGGNHLRGRVSASTWRLSLAAALVDELALALDDGELTPLSHARLTEWMGDHLRLVVHPVHDRDGLSRLEHAVLARLDPPLNLDGMTATPLRTVLSHRRAAITGSRRRLRDEDRL